MRKVYLDHAATTPVAKEVAEKMQFALGEAYGNPSSVHQFGRQARELVNEARRQVAGLIGAEPDEIIFTGGGTEADNLALVGGTRPLRSRGRHVITSKIEHHAVLHTCEHLEQSGFDVTYLDVDQYGMVSPEAVAEALRPDTVMVSIMFANNEMGTVQPIEGIAKVVREHGALLHVDAVQAVGQVPVDVKALGIDLMTISAHKIYGPKGIGALYANKDVKLEPIVFGGGHEFGLRAGTENVPGIVGFGAAAELARRELPERIGHLQAMRDRLYRGLFDRIRDIRLNGHPEQRLPNNVNISILRIEGEALLLNLDMRGIAVSSGSACTSGSLEPSHVLLAMGVKPFVAQGAVRMTVGRGTTAEDIDYVVEVVPDVVARLRTMSPFKQRNGGS